METMGVTAWICPQCGKSVGAINAGALPTLCGGCEIERDLNERYVLVDQSHSNKRGERMATMLELAERGAGIFAVQKAERAKSAVMELERAMEATIKDLDDLRERLGVEDDALWLELDPQICSSSYSVQAFGVRGAIYRDLSGWKDHALGKLSPESLALFIYDAQRQRAIKLEKALAYLSGEDGRDPTWAYRNARSVCDEVAGLWNSPEVVAARRAYLLRNEIVGLDHTPDWQWYDTWLEDAKQLGIETAGVEVLREKTRKVAELGRDAYAREKEVAGEDEEQKARAFVEWLRSAPDAYGVPEAREMGGYMDFLVTALTRIEKATAAEVARQKKEELEQKAFYPFRYYEVAYAAFAQEDPDFNDREIGVFYDDALTMPDRDGWYRDRSGHMKRVFNPVGVTARDVLCVKDMPWWCDMHNEAGVLFRVPPANVERL